MKKKLIQILMLLVVAVSIGAFVSCKDTNEDLYNELHNQVGDSDKTLAERLAELQARIEAVKCQCGETGAGSLSDRVGNLESLLSSLGIGGGGSGSGSSGDGSGSGIGGAIINYGDNTSGGNTGSTTLDLLFGDIAWLLENNGNIAQILKDYGTDIATWVAFRDAYQNQLIQALTDLANLQAQVDAIKPCTCDFATLWTKVSNIEQQLITIESNIQAAADAATAAQSTADAATALANAATQAATDAATAAANADAKAVQAGLDAAAAQQYAETVKLTADEALQKALDAIALATQIQTTLQTQINTNTTNIELLQGNITTIQNTLNEYGTKISDNAAAILTNANNIATNVANIETNRQAIEDLKTTVGNIASELTTVKGDAAQALLDAAAASAQASTNAQAIATLENLANQNKSDIATLQTDLGALQTAVNTLSSQVDTNTTNITDLTTKFTTLNSTVTTMGENVTQLLTDVAQLKTDLAQVQADCAANLATAKQYADEQIAAAISDLKSEILSELLNYYTKNETYSKEEIDNMLKDMDVSELLEKVGSNTARLDAIDELLKTIKSCTCDEQALKDAIDQIKSSIIAIWDAIDDAEEGINTNAENIAKNAEEIDKINQLIADVINANIEKLTEDLSNLDGKVSGMELILNKIKKEYISKSEVQKITDAIIAKAQADSTDFKNRMDVIGDSIANVLTDLTSLEARVAILENSNFVTHDEIENFATKDEVAELAATVDQLSSRVTSNSNKITKLNEAVTKIKDQIKTLQDDVTDLQNRMDTAEEKLDKALQDIDKIKEDVSAIQDYLAKQVTGITIQGTYNPMFGSFNLPTGTQSNILLAFYGLPTKDIYFPATIDNGNYIRTYEALTEKDMEMLGLNSSSTFLWPGNDMPFMFDQGYAGKIYMTINPNTADVSGLQPKIVNSLDEDSYITLKPIEPSTEKLQFGWTRADQSSNGFYEAEAWVTPMDVQKINAPAFNTAAIMDAAKNVKDALTQMAQNQTISGTGSKLEQVASDVNTIVKGLRFDRSALKVSYTTTDADNNETEHSVYSQYNLAATAFHPLNLGTAKDFHYQTVPGYERVNALLDRISNEVHNRVHVFFKDFNSSALVEKIANLQIKDISVPDLTDDLLAEFVLHMDTTFIMDGLSYHLQMPVDVNVPVKFEKDLTIPVDIDGLKVSVPVKIEKDVEVDLSDVYIQTPTVVVKGSASGKPTDVTDKDGNTISSLIIPILDDDGKVTGYTEIPLSNFGVNVEIEAGNDYVGGNAGKLIYIGGTPVAKVVIDETVEGTVNIHDNVSYHLVIEDTFSTTVNLDKWFYFGDNGTDKKSFVLKFDYDMRKAATDLWGVAQDALGDVNTMLADIRDIVKEVNNLVDKVNSYEDKIYSTVDNALDKVRSYLDKINSTIVNLVNSTNDRFQPFMVASTSKGMKRLSGSKNYPTQLANDITLFATSQTMELFVPLARKHVAVTNVFKGSASAQGGDADCKAKLTAANSAEKLNVVLNGTEREIKLNSLASGYVYEIAYSALDFEGQIATRKYYITAE